MRRRDESGGAISLWVVLMVPVSAFAAVVAMAGPQRMAAESSMQEAADDMATLAVALRAGQNEPTGELSAFLPECATRSRDEHAALAELSRKIDALDLNDPEFNTKVVDLDGRLARQFEMFGMEPRLFKATDKEQLRTDFDRLKKRLDDRDLVCTALFEAILRDLGYLGVDMGSLRGFYSDSLAEKNLVGLPPCRISAKVRVQDAVHVALVADWLYAGWAAAQVWPDGARMGAESIGRLNRTGDSDLDEDCLVWLDVLDSQGRPVWLEEIQAGQPNSRELVQSVPRRTAFSG